jgi:hypothetical protein
VAAHDRKRFLRAMHSSGYLLALEKLSLYSGFSYVHQIMTFHSIYVEDDFRLKLRLLRHLIRLKVKRLNVLEYTPNRLFYPMASSVWQLPDPLHLTTSLLQLLKGIEGIENDKSNILHREELKLQYVNKSLLIKYFILSTRELLACVQLVYWN